MKECATHCNYTLLLLHSEHDRSLAAARQRESLYSLLRKECTFTLLLLHIIQLYFAGHSAAARQRESFMISWQKWRRKSQQVRESFICKISRICRICRICRFNLNADYRLSCPNPYPATCPGYIRYEKFVPVMTHVLMERRYKPATEEQMLRAFEVWLWGLRRGSSSWRIFPSRK